MTEKQRGKERTFKHEMGNIVVGTLDKKNCTSCYLSLETYITPEYSLIESVDKIRRRLKANINTIGLTYLDGDLSRYLINIDYNITKEKDKPLKTSFIRFELTLFSKDKFEFDDDFIYTLTQMGDTIITLIESVDEMIIGNK
jgi:hypothetical protein